MRPKIILIVGPTASGKTGLGIEIAKRVGGEVVSVDSRQVYRGMDIGTAKVSPTTTDDLSFRGVQPPSLQRTRLPFLQGRKEAYRDLPLVVDGVVHWGIDLADPDEEFTVADFKAYAEQKIKEIVRRGQVPILVGGTGLWVSALIDNFDLTETASDPALRAELEARPLGDLFAQYKRLDPEGAEVIDRENKRRVVRALEVCLLTGKPFSTQQTRGEPKYEVLQIGLRVPREVLNERINARVDEMIARGLVDEVRTLRARYGCDVDAMTGIGYRQVCAFLDGKCSLEEAVEETKKATRHYAKRQMTWFKRDPRIQWVDRPEEVKLFPFMSLPVSPTADCA
ncbi:tRNA (adenosine(37)-N6)-dimethylallyltransferase MiaA [Candidatus Parcubacteria bacterium]|nr:tRNA (adenosine(37)-N6)-dimethylallyltransferase MiaA [Candidatus Parcubacteria bacterium]